MTNEELNRANAIQKEIRQLDDFIYVAEKVWTGSLIKRTSKLLFKSHHYGVFDEAEYEMNTEMKNRVLDVLRERSAELKQKLSEI